MSPSFKEPRESRESARSVWTTTWIFVTLIALTALMAMFMSRLVQESQRHSGPEVRASHRP